MKVIKTVNLIVLSPDKTKICLLKKINEKTSIQKWAFVGGTIYGEETNGQAITRILKDNMSCEVISFKELKKSETRAKIAVIKSQYLIGNIGGEIKLDKRKYSEFKWFDLNSDLLKLEFAFNEHVIVDFLLKSFKKN
jgi:ADP-ribose pyrophosphatase YjhB (NUDIX family)